MTNDIPRIPFIVGVKPKDYPDTLDVVLVLAINELDIAVQLSERYESVGNFEYEILKEIMPNDNSIILWSIYNDGMSEGYICKTEAYDCWEEMCQ